MDAANLSPQNHQAHVPERTRKVYNKPNLMILGDVRTTILGGSPGLGESGVSKMRIRMPLTIGYEQMDEM